MPPPSVYLFYGDDPLEIRQAVSSLRERLGDSAELNLQQFEATALDLDLLAESSQALPFLAERRLIVIEHAEQLPGGADYRQSLDDLLSALPPSTAVVFTAVLDSSQRQAAKDFEKRSPAYAWTAANPDASFVRRYNQPSGVAFTRWLTDRAAEAGLSLEPEAAELLAALVDEDLRLAEQELRKLIDYAGERHTISAAEVELLTPIYGQTNVFEVVDGLGRDGSWLLKLHQLMQEQDPSYVFLMVVRQFRLMLQARQALDEGRDPAQQLRVPGFVARKVAAQARNFDAHSLESFYARLAELDVAAKRGEADLSLDLLPLLASFAPAQL